MSAIGFSGIVCIYKIVSPSNRVYIGQTTNLKNRVDRYKYAGVPNQVLLQRSIVKYGWGVHTLSIEKQFIEVPSKEQLTYWEQHYIDKYTADGSEMLNIRGAGSNGKHSEETKRKIGKANKLKLKGVRLSPERVAKIKRALIGNKRRKGCTLSQEHKDIISLYNRSKILTDETKRKISESRVGDKNWAFGKAFSSEHRKNMSESQKRRLVSVEQKSHISSMGKLRRIPITQYSLDGEPIKTYTSATQAGESLGIDRRLIQKCASGKVKTSHNFKWKYTNGS